MPLSPATPPTLLIFDENGNSFLNGLRQPNAVAAPQGGALYLSFPNPVVPGVVDVKGTPDEPTTAPFGYSDRLIFDNFQNRAGQLQGLMIFQSWIDDADLSHDLADTQFQLPLSELCCFRARSGRQQRLYLDGRSGRLLRRQRWRVPSPRRSFWLLSPHHPGLRRSAERRNCQNDLELTPGEVLILFAG